MDQILDFDMNFESQEQSEADKKLLVAFYKGVIKNEIKSIEAGRPIFDEIDLVKIITPGSRDNFIGDATPDYQARFPQQWARYKAGRDQKFGGGTPLTMLPWLSEAQIAEFGSVGCHTIEHLVGMPDSLSQKFMGHLQLKQKAQAYLDVAKEAAPTLKLQKELETRDETIRQLNQTLAAMQAKLEALDKRVPLTA